MRAELVRRLFERGRGQRWGLSEADFRDALERSVAHRFRDKSPSESEVEDYLASLNVEHLALACACARGCDTAWDHFVTEFRPALLAAAASCAPPDVARELADSIYADLFGLEERDGVRRSLFDYFHGRSTLSGWLRAVLAQRAVDHARASRRFEPLAEERLEAMPSVEQAPDVDRDRYLPLIRRALTSATHDLPARDRLRLGLYYRQQIKLRAIGRVLGESEATVSRKLERTRTELRKAVEGRLVQNGLSRAEIEECFEQGAGDSAFDLAKLFPDCKI